MEIRPPDPSEHDALAALAVRAYVAVPGIERYADHLGELRDVAGRVHDNVVLVAYIGGRPVGLVTYVPGHDSPLAEFEDRDAAGIRALAVDPGYQRRGIGRALTVACLDQARADGRRLVVLHTTDELVAAHKLYGSMGFERDPARDYSADGINLSGYVYRLEEQADSP